MSKHTPGPWSVVAGGPWIVGANGKTVALVHQLDQECEANSRLIAAAPDLLEALHRMRAVAWGGEAQRAEAIRQAEAAIAKAEGRS